MKLKAEAYLNKDAVYETEEISHVYLEDIYNIEENLINYMVYKNGNL